MLLLPFHAKSPTIERSPYSTFESLFGSLPEDLVTRVTVYYC